MGKVLLKPPDSDHAVAVEFQRSGDRFTAHVDGHVLEGLLEEAPGGRMLFRLGHHVIPCHVLRRDRQIEVWLGGQMHRFEIVGGKAPRTGAAAATVTHEITAPMPGTVLRIHVKAGDAFSAHQPLIIMESMKMEMPVEAMSAGTVIELCVEEGQSVEESDVVCRLQAP